ncbi:MAG: hypothetical protein IKE43_09045 [Coriobacteriales bacterium]|nr:hypothetical protein [Coriobacteriales bacterium]
MERREFVKNTFGLVLLAASAGLGILGAESALAADVVSAESKILFTTPAVKDAEAAEGPVIQSGIELVALANEKGANTFVGRYRATELFTVDKMGVLLISLADGTHTLEDMAQKMSKEFGQAVNPADVAMFFITLGQAGYLQNKVLVNLYEIPA